MARSRRKTPIMRCGGRCSDKQFRRRYNRRLRRINKMRLQKQGEEFLPKLIREVSDVWSGCRDHVWDFRDYKNGKHNTYGAWEWDREDGVFRKRLWTKEDWDKEKERQKKQYEEWLRK